MISKWLHIAEFGGDPWALPIHNAINEAAKSSAVSNAPKQLGELAIYISIRLNMLLRVVTRINSEARDILHAAKARGPEHEFTANGGLGCALKIDDDLKYDFLTEVETLLSQAQSSVGLLNNFLRVVYCHVGKLLSKREQGKLLLHVLADRGQRTDWLEYLAKRRNFFTHRGAPYLAIDVSNEPWDLIIMQENVDRFDDPTKFFSIRDLTQIGLGFDRGKLAVQQHVIELYEHRVNHESI
jgi:hypothetical protein